MTKLQNPTYFWQLRLPAIWESKISIGLSPIFCKNAQRCPDSILTPTSGIMTVSLRTTTDFLTSNSELQYSTEIHLLTQKNTIQSSANSSLTPYLTVIFIAFLWNDMIGLVIIDQVNSFLLCFCWQSDCSKVRQCCIGYETKVLFAWCLHSFN